jgi:hypothetical protein
MNVRGTNAGTVTTIYMGGGSAANTVKIGSTAPASTGDVNGISGNRQ